MCVRVCVCACVLPLFNRVRGFTTQVAQRNEAELIAQKALLVLQLFVLNLEKHLETTEEPQ